MSNLMNLIGLVFVLHYAPILASRQLLDTVADNLNQPVPTYENRNSSRFIWVGRVDAYLPDIDNRLPTHHEKGWLDQEKKNSTIDWQPYLVIGVGEFLGNTVRGITGEFPVMFHFWMQLK